MSNLPHSITLLLTGVFIGFSLVASIDYEWSAENQLKNQQHLSNLYKEASIGTPRNEIAFNLIKNKFDNESLFFINKGAQDLILLSSPKEFLQGNWVLIFCFKADVLIGSRIGLADDISITPTGATQGKGECSL